MPTVPHHDHRAQENRPDAARRLSQDDTRFAFGRIAGFQYVTVAVFLFLVTGFWTLQVREGDVNSQLAERNRIKTVPVLAPRGKILDRDGRVIVDNEAAFSLLLTRENLKDEHIDGMAAGLNLDAAEIRARVKRFASRPKYVPVLIKQDLSPADITFVESHRDAGTYPEMELVRNQQRLYPRTGLAAHTIGYVGEVSEPELSTAEFAKYSQGDIVGKAGLERQYNDLLIGVDGQRRVVVDSSGREREMLESTEATPGSNLRVTLDLDLQAVAELALEGKRGAVVALDPRSGEVLSMVSRPAFDPNAFAGRITTEYWKQLTSGNDNPMLNRAIQAQFAPGSTFKPIMALAGLETGTIEDHDTFHCPGGATFFGRYFKCWQKKGHGTVNLHHGIVQSCDVFFYNLGNKLGIDEIAKYAEMAGIGKKTGIDLPGEAEGLMPSSKWKLRTQRQKWYAGETISVAIGQGAVTVTPLQLASAIGGVVSGGVWYKPHLVKTAAAAEPRRAEFKPESVASIVSGMYGVINEGGTGAGSRIEGVEFSGKTGSAQRVSIDLRKSGLLDKDDTSDNGWFVGFAPRQNPEIVVAVLLEGGEHGALAAPVARDVIKSYFDKKIRVTQQQLTLQPPLALLHPPRN
ncbi:MAG: penicillin-binding protein 2 [Bryobacterales bacterium]|nr:penicillin-binding protein 2 [Bryobacterales bacterium]